MTERYFSHEVKISCDIELVYEYVTNPNLWHEWYPSSQPLSEKFSAQEVGQKFKVVTVQKPIRAIPLSLAKSLYYTVVKSEPSTSWEVVASSDLVDSITTYTLQKTNKGTLFKREFRYTAKSWLKILEPILLRKSIISQANEGVNNLKARVESNNA